MEKKAKKKAWPGAKGLNQAGSAAGEGRDVMLTLLRAQTRKKIDSEISQKTRWKTGGGAHAHVYKQPHIVGARLPGRHMRILASC
jgi:hypothetical protein